MKNTERNIKIYGLVIGIALFILLLAGLSYAYYQGKVVDNTTISGDIGMCFEVNYTKGGNVSGADLLLLDKNQIINNGQITIRNGMALTSISAGMDNTTCPNTYGYMDVYMKNTSLNNAFISGDSAGALKYVIASYDKNQYPTATISALKGHSFDIIASGTVNSTDSKLLFTDPMLPLGSLADYLVIFYLDGDLTFNDGGYTDFNTTISAIASPSIDGSVKSLVTNLSTPTGTVVNNSKTYNVNTASNIIVDTMDNIRYYGSNPNNYIKFNCDEYPDTNCETWRIIGVVDGKVKLIRGSQIGTFSWDTSASTVNSGNGINEWSQSDLMKLLNPGYDDNFDYEGDSTYTSLVNNSLYYNSNSGTCYNGQSNASTTTGCNFTSSGVQGIKNDTTRNKIAETTFYTGGWSSASVYPNVILDKERGTTVISNPSDGITRTTSWLGRVAVPYPSDYGYAADLSLCTGKNLVQYNDSNCTANNWMKNIITNNGSNIGWLLTPHSGHAYYVWLAHSSGSVYYNLNYTYLARGVVPVLYLSADEVISGGSGTETNPYILAA